MLKKLICLIFALYIIATSVFTVFTIWLASPSSPIGAYKELLKVTFVNPRKNGWDAAVYEKRVEEAFNNFAEALANKEY